MKIIVKHPNIKMFTLVYAQQPGVIWPIGTCLLRAYDFPVHEITRIIPVGGSVFERPNEMVHIIISNMHDSPLKERLEETVNTYKNIPTREEIRQLIILHHLAR